MVLFMSRRFEMVMRDQLTMGRLVVHAHGVPKEKAMKHLVEMYGERLRARGVRIEYHASKQSADAYVDRLLALGGSLILLDEAGQQDTSVSFARRFETWQLSSQDVHLALGPAEGWPDDARLADATRLSLSNMTFPHELAAVMLVEQLYRASEIQRGTGYHKA